MDVTTKPSDNGKATVTPPKDTPATDRLTVDTAAETNLDPFANLDRLRIGPDYDAVSGGVKKVLTVVPCRKPNRQEFVRVRPGADWHFETTILEDKVNRESYLVDASLRSELLGELRPVCLFVAINRQNDLFLWQVTLPDATGKTNSWNESAMQSARLAQESWVRVVANMGGGMYDSYVAAAELAAPEWPVDLEMSDIIRLCFKNRFITNADHPILRSLRGEE